MIKKLLLAAITVTFSTAAFSQPGTDTIHTAQQLGEVVVTGQYAPQSLKNSVYQVKVINNERIRLSGATNVQQVLNTQLGFRFSNDIQLGITDVQLNGMSGRNVKILIDGVPMVDRFDERVSLSQVDVNTIERIEIVEGPMSVSYGSDAMAGVINIITKTQYKNSLSVSARVQEETAGDEYYPFSYKGVHNQNIGINYKKNSWLFSAGGTHNDFSGFGGDDYGRAKTWLPKEQWFGNAKIGYNNKNFNIYYRIDGLNEEIKDRNAINFTNYKAVDQKFTSKRFTQQLQGDYNFSKKLRYNGLFAYTTYQRHTETNTKDFELGTITPGTADGQQDLSKLNAFSTKHTFQYQINNRISLQPGIDINHEKASGQRIEGEPQINDYALFVSSEIKATSKISVRPGLRFVTNSVYDAPPVIPSINTKFSINKNLDARLSYGYGFRAPTLRELYFEFVDVNHNIFGNKALKAEYSNAFNGSLTWVPDFAKKVSLHSTLSLFYNSFKNQILLDQDPNDASRYSYFNLDRSKTMGAGLENKLSVKNLDASLGFLYTALHIEYDKSYTKTDDRDYLWTPEINANVIYNINKIKTKLGLFYKFVGKKPVFNTGMVGTQPTILLNETGSYNLADFTITTIAHKYVTVNAGVKNIFDVTTVNNTAVGGTHADGGPLSLSYGRSYFIGLAFNWSKN